MTVSVSTWPEDIAILHILPQRDWHSPAWIVGNRLALQQLRDSLNRALEHIPDGESPTPPTMHPAMTDDGEGYPVMIREIPSTMFSNVPFGYTDDIAATRDDWPDWLMEGLRG